MTKSTYRSRGSLLLATTILSIGLATPVMAQDAEAEEDGSEIVVTGSRVRGEAPVGSSVISLGRTEIEQSSAVTVDRMIKEIPQNFDLGVSENSRGQSGGSGNITYGNSVNLRGIGPYATLVLIDGHRVVNNSRSTDPSVLPSLGVERVEVVADSASAIYGSDAVAGVVNLIPRRTLDGGEMFARAGIADEGDFHEYAMGVALGKVFDRGQVMVAFEHVERSGLIGRQRDFFKSDFSGQGGTDGRSPRCDPGNIKIGSTSYAIPVGGVTQATAGSLVAGTTNRCDELDEQHLIPKNSYDSVNGTATFDLTDRISLKFDGFYSKRSFYRRGAYSTTAVRAPLTVVPDTNPWFVRPAGFTGTSYNLDLLLTDLPRNDTSGFAESWQVTPGISVKLFGDWEAEALVGYGKTNDFSGAYTGLNVSAFNAALASSDPNTAYDPYGLHRTNPAILPGLANQIFLAPTNGKLTTYAARTNGSLMDLPGGSVKLAAGYERQEFKVALGSARGAPTTPIVFRNFGRNVDSLYAELYVPIFGSSNAIPGFQRLELNAAVRHDKYSDVGETTNPKFGLNWTPVDGIKLRGSYGTSFRAPTIPEIYGNSNNLFIQNYSNPAGGTIQGVALSGVNLGLKPETATTWSVGADIEPINKLRLSLTYWDVNYKNQVLANLSNLTILRDSAFYAGTGIILRDAAAQAKIQEYITAGVGTVGGNAATALGATVFVDGRSFNLGVSRTRGIDLALDYEADIGSEDTLRFNLNGTYLTSYKVAVTPTATMVDKRNTIFNPLKFKARGSVAWDHGPLTVRGVLTHVGGYTNNIPTTPQEVSSYNPVDLSLTWRVGDSQAEGFFAKGLTFSVEARNLFDEDPPFVLIAPNGNGSGGYDASAADPIGRMFAVSVRKSF